MVKKKHNVALALRADIMLLSHTEFLAHVSPAAARKLVQDFKIVKCKLAANPMQFPFADDLDAKGIPPETYRKCVFHGRYKAIFLVEGSNVFIDAIIDCRQANRSLYNPD